MLRLMSALTKTVVAVVVWGALAVVLAGAPDSSARIQSEPEPGSREIPSFVLRDFESGHYVYLSRICYPGREKPQWPRSPVVLNFMSSDCIPCRKELPLLIKIAREYRERGLKVFVIATDSLSKREQLARVLEALGVDCPVLLDPYKVVCKKLEVESIPQTFVLNAERRQVGRLVGFHDSYEEDLRAALDKAVASPE